ncbi:MAG: hypothetical protein OJF49_004060 [Ktedonobacterales bacterium]|nr:MAG: hypothetical protein OJF49_004060 [Ktedonobacterales bacterium]
MVREALSLKAAANPGGEHAAGGEDGCGAGTRHERVVETV